MIFNPVLQRSQEMISNSKAANSVLQYLQQLDTTTSLNYGTMEASNTMYPVIATSLVVDSGGFTVNVGAGLGSTNELAINLFYNTTRTNHYEIIYINGKICFVNGRRQDTEPTDLGPIIYKQKYSCSRSNTLHCLMTYNGSWSLVDITAMPNDASKTSVSATKLQDMSTTNLPSSMLVATSFDYTVDRKMDQLDDMKERLDSLVGTVTNTFVSR